MRYIALVLIAVSAIAYWGWKTITPVPEVSTDPASGILLQSDDTGYTWHDKSAGLPQGLRCSNALIRENMLYLAKSNGMVFRSPLALTGQWISDEMGPPMLDNSGIFEEKSIHGLFNCSSGLYASLYEHGMYKHIPEKNTWQKVSGSLKESPLSSLIELPDHRMVAATSEGIQISKDSGKTWQKTYTGGWITSIIASGNILLAGGGLGILRSEDGGQHWTTVITDEAATYRLVNLNGRFGAVRTGGTIRQEETAIKLRTSTDGIHWVDISENMPDRHPIDLTQVGNYLYLTHKTGISRSADGGFNWMPLPLPGELNQQQYYQLVVSGNTIYAVKMWNGC